MRLGILGTLAILTSGLPQVPEGYEPRYVEPEPEQPIAREPAPVNRHERRAQAARARRH